MPRAEEALSRELHEAMAESLPLPAPPFEWRLWGGREARARSRVVHVCASGKDYIYMYIYMYIHAYICIYVYVFMYV